MAWHLMTPVAVGVVLALVALEVLPPPSGEVSRWIAGACVCAAAALGGVLLSAVFAGRAAAWVAVPTVLYVAILPIDLFSRAPALHEVLNPLAAGGCVLALMASARSPDRAWPVIRFGLGTAATIHLLGPLIAPGQAALVYLGAAVVLFAGCMALMAEERERRSHEAARIHAEAGHAHSERDHEIRNILSGLSGASHLLGGSRTGLSPQERNAVRDAFDAEVDRLWALLDLQRAGATRPRALHEPIDVVAVIREVADLWAVGGRLTFATDQPAVWANCSPAVLKQAMTNCLANCARYAPGTDVAIRVSTRGMRARIEIADDGPGPGRTVHFSPDTSAESRHRSSCGLGIGLQDTARVLGHYGGTVTLRPGPAGGAVAEIEIPSVSADAPFVTFHAS